MTLIDRFLGMTFAVVYALRRSKVGFLRLHVAATLVVMLAAAYTLYRGWMVGFAWWRVAVVLTCLAIVGLTLLAEIRRYVVFRARDESAAEAVELAPEQRVFVRGSGNFEVSHMRRYLAEVPVVFWTTELADHVLAAKVRALNILGVGVPKMEKGWWYIFLDPPKVTGIIAGELCFGTRCRPAVRVQYQAEKGIEVVYLSCDDAAQRQALLNELRAKAAAAGAKRARRPEGFTT